MRLRMKHRQRKYLMVFPVLLIFVFGMLFAPYVQSFIPHTLVESGFRATYKSQYDNSGTKDLAEDHFIHTAPAGDWSPSKYRVTLGQVTTWDEYTLADQDDDYGSHTFEGSAITNEEAYRVEFDYGDSLQPSITRTADPTDTQFLNPVIVVDDLLFNGDWATSCVNWEVDGSESTPTDGIYNDCEDDIISNDSWTYTFDDDDFTHGTHAIHYEGSNSFLLNTGAVVGDTGTIAAYKDFTVSSDDNVWMGFAVYISGSPFADKVRTYLDITSEGTHYYIVFWMDDDTACPGNDATHYHIDLGATDGVWTYITANITEIASNEFSLSSFDSQMQIYIYGSDNSGAGGIAIFTDCLFLHGQADTTIFPDFFDFTGNGIDEPFYSPVGLTLGQDNGDDGTEFDQVAQLSIDEDVNQYYWEWEIDNPLHADNGTYSQDMEIVFLDGSANAVIIDIVPSALVGMGNDTDGVGTDTYRLVSDDTSGLIDLTTLLQEYEAATGRDMIYLDNHYNTRVDSDTQYIIYEWLIYEGHQEIGEETFVVDAGVNDPAGTDFYEMSIDITNGDAGYTLQTSDLTLGGDWADASGWSVISCSGNGNSGAWVIQMDDYSGAWEDLDGTFTIVIVSDVNDVDGYNINYSNCKVGCSMNEMGLHIDEGTATVDNFDGDGATITYDNEGGILVFSVELDTTDGMNGAKTIVWAEDNYSGALTDWLFTYDLNYQVRDYVSCNAAGITINTETPTYIALTSGAVIVLQNDLDTSIEFDETGDEIPDDDINNCIFDVTVEGDYRITEMVDITADDDNPGYFHARYTKLVTPHSTPTYDSMPVEFHFGEDFGDFGGISVSMKQPDGTMQELTYLTEFTIEGGSTKIRIKRAPMTGSDWQNGLYEFWIRFNADEDAYYELTNTEAEDLIGLTVSEWEKYTDVLVTEEQSQYIMKGLIENMDVREEFCFSIGQEIPSKHEGKIEAAEIWRYETGQSGEEIFTNIYELTPNEAKTKWWGTYHISPKYDDYLMLYIDAPTMTVEKIRAENTQYGSYKQLNVRVNSYEEALDDVYMDIDLGEQNILPQRYNFLIVEWTGEGITEVIEGRVRDYHLYWKRDTMNQQAYNYIIFLQEKTTTEKFDYMWLQLTQQEILTGGITLVAEGEEAWEYPTIEVPTPEITLPDIPSIRFPRIRADISPINWGAIGERLIYYGRFATGYSSLISAMVVTISLVILVNQLNTMQKTNIQQKKALKGG